MYKHVTRKNSIRIIHNMYFVFVQFLSMFFLFFLIFFAHSSTHCVSDFHLNEITTTMFSSMFHNWTVCYSIVAEAMLHYSILYLRITTFIFLICLSLSCLFIILGLPIDISNVLTDRYVRNAVNHDTITNLASK